MHDISVIIPVYNGENFIEKSVESIIKNKVDIEVLLINDGSSDNTYDICKKLSREYSCVKAVTQEHKGVSAARNLGIKLADSKYLYFFDSDDFVDSDFLETLLYYARKYDNALLCFGYIKETKEDTLFKTSDFISDYLVGEEAFEFILNNKYSSGYLWNKLFTAKLINESNLFFDENIRISEDLLFTIGYLNVLKKLAYVNEQKYHYIIHNDNTMHRKSKSNCMSRINALQKAKKIFSKNNYCTKTLDYLIEREIVSTILFLIKNNLNHSDIKDLQRNLRQCKIVLINNGYKYYKVILTHFFSLLPISLSIYLYSNLRK